MNRKACPNTYADLEIRILEKQERGYPVEIVFNGDQEFPGGFLDPAAQPQIERAFSAGKRGTPVSMAFRGK